MHFTTTRFYFDVIPLSKLLGLALLLLLISCGGGGGGEGGGSNGGAGEGGGSNGAGGNDGSNTPPTITGLADNTAYIDTLYTFTPIANDAENQPLTFSIINQPSWLDFDTSTGMLSGTPSVDDIQDYLGIIIRVADNDGESTPLAPFDIAVMKIPISPTPNQFLCKAIWADYDIQFNGQSFEYTTEELDTDGVVDKIITWQPTVDKDGHWYGQLIMETHYRNGVLDFEDEYITEVIDDCNVWHSFKRVNYYPEGNVKAVGFYIMKNLERTRFDYYANGLLVDYHKNGEKSSERTFAAKQDYDGNWQSVYDGNSISYSYHENGAIKSEDPWTSRQNSDGTWENVYVGVYTSYYPNGILEYQHSYVANQNGDGSWVSLSAGDYIYNYDSGHPKEKSFLVAKQNSDGTWTNLHEGLVRQYYIDGALEKETPFVAKQNDDGTWASVKEGVYKEYWSGNGNIKKQYSYVLKQSSDGFWQEVTIAQNEYDSFGNLEFETTTFAKQNSDGTWASLIQGPKIRYYRTGEVRESTIYVHKQNSDGNWVNLISSVTGFVYLVDGTTESETVNYVITQDEDGNWSSMRGT